MAFRAIWPSKLFDIVNAEVFVWDAVQDALQQAGLQVGVGRLIEVFGELDEDELNMLRSQLGRLAGHGA